MSWICGSMWGSSFLSSSLFLLQFMVPLWNMVRTRMGRSTFFILQREWRRCWAFMMTTVLSSLEVYMNVRWTPKDRLHLRAPDSQWDMLLIASPQGNYNLLGFVKNTLWNLPVGHVGSSISAISWYCTYLCMQHFLDHRNILYFSIVVYVMTSTFED